VRGGRLQRRTRRPLPRWSGRLDSAGRPRFGPGEFYPRGDGVRTAPPGSANEGATGGDKPLPCGPHLAAVLPFSNIPEIGFPH
jgi:hypothetical protein